MSRTQKFVSSVVALVAVAAIAIPVYAHCGKCAGSAKEMATAMDAGKTGLAAAITAAETAAKGKAVAALAGMHDGKLDVAVYVSSGDKLQVVMVDAAGKAGAPAEAKELPHAGHAAAPAEKKPAPKGG